MGLGEVIDEIKSLAHFREFPCTKCGNPIRVHALNICAHCPNCGIEHKCRAFGGIGTEIEDVIDAVLEWAGEGETFEAVLARHREIREDSED